MAFWFWMKLSLFKYLHKALDTSLFAKDQVFSELLGIQSNCLIVWKHEHLT